MLRPFALLLIAITVASPALITPARAFSPDGATAPLTDFGGGRGLSLGVFGVDTAGSGVAEERPLQYRIATVGLTWARDGWSVGVAGGQVQFGIPTVFEAVAPMAAFSVGREIAGIAGGTVSAEFRAARLFGSDGTTDILSSTLRWTRKF